VIAQAAIATAESELTRLHDRGDATGAQVTEEEAVLADAKITAERAQRAYAAAEKRLTLARDAETQKSKGAMRERLTEALAARAQCAERIDAGARAMSQALADLQSHDGTIREAIQAGVLKEDSAFALNRGPRLVELALQKAGAIEGAWFGPKDRPGCFEVVAEHNSALAV
jgi:hypothetical protein